ncbi:MAG: nitroreductase family protein [Candidatus Omnitrophica bacterium]|nr:nitroreductase family protein [Candidatus Omnitrophota bacterium]
MKSNIYDLITRRRTIRFFKQKKIAKQAIKRALNAARCAPSAANLQFIEYLVIASSSHKDKVFPFLSWAGYIKPLRTPSEKNRPVLYIIVLANKKRSDNYNLRDIGAAVMNLILAFLSEDVACCWIGAFDGKGLRKALKIPAGFEIDSVVAAGYPAEKPKLETSATTVKYWLDDNKRLHVPKRPLSDIVHWDKIYNSP